MILVEKSSLCLQIVAVPTRTADYTLVYACCSYSFFGGLLTRKKYHNLVQSSINKFKTDFISF